MIKVIGWIDYDNFNFGTCEETDEIIDAVIKDILTHGYKFGGDDHENMLNCCPLLSNGKALRLSWRSWGYIMAKAYNLKTQDGSYNYILWYMGEYGPEKRVFPKNEPIDLTGIDSGDTYIYNISDEELNAVYYISFNKLIMPIAEYEKMNIRTLDKINFIYNNEIIIESIVNEIRFSYYEIDELFNNVEVLDNSNYKNLSEESLNRFLKSKYNNVYDKFIIIYFDYIRDLRSDNKLIYI